MSTQFRSIRMLKENKKLASKVESLTRKVQTLQTKLVAAKASIPAPVENPTNITPQPSIQPSSLSKTIDDRPRSVTLTNTSIPSVSAASVPVVSASLSSAPSCALRAPSHRAVSGPSALSRPRTPDEKSMQNPPAVFKVKTPERISSPPTESASSSTGKKRRAPDDFEACESLPPQGFTTECVPSTELSEHTTTPHRRRMLSGLQSGFTPVRNRSRPVVSMPSPKRLMTMKSGERPSPVITDVTNSPRGQSSKTKRSWLGKIRGAQSTSSRPVDSKPRLDRETS